jgi:hypothetical protein
VSTVYIGLHQLKAPSVSPRSSRLRAGLYFRFALPFRLVEEMTRNLISLVSVLSTRTHGLGAGSSTSTPAISFAQMAVMQRLHGERVA